MQKRFLILLSSLIICSSLVVVVVRYFIYQQAHAKATTLALSQGGWSMGTVWNVTLGQDLIIGFAFFNNATSTVTIEKAEVFKDDGIEVVEVDFIKNVNASDTNLVLAFNLGTPMENGWITYPVKGYQIEPQNYTTAGFQRDPRGLTQGAIWFKVTSKGNHTIEGVQFAYSYLDWLHDFNYTYDDVWVYGL